MDGENRLAGQRFGYDAASFDFPPDLCALFTSEEYRTVGDAAARRARVSDLVAVQIAPRLAALHATVQPTDHPTEGEIAELARLVLSPDGRGAAAYVAGLKGRGLSAEILFEDLLEPAARLLGHLWDEDEVDFIDVTLGVGRLQALLSVFNCTHELAAARDRRSVLMLTVPGEQHLFGIAMVEKLLGAGGWRVTSEREASPALAAQLVKHQRFAIAGLTVSNKSNLEAAAATIAAIRQHSCNESIGVIVGGPVFSADPGLTARVGADGTAATATTAVVLAQKLLDTAIAAEMTKGESRWMRPSSRGLASSPVRNARG